MYLSTSLPGPAVHCLPNSTSYDPPTSGLEIFTRYSTFKDLNCGDLIFSGHMFQNLSFTIITYLYSNRMFNNKLSCFLTIIQILTSVSQVIFIIAARNHYSIDIVVAIYVAITSWYIHLNKYPIIDEEDNIRMRIILNEIKNNIEMSTKV